jgi:hypothetical protein
LPVQANKIRAARKSKAAKALSLKVLPSLRARADEVSE